MSSFDPEKKKILQSVKGHFDTGFSVFLLFLAEIHSLFIITGFVRACILKPKPCPQDGLRRHIWESLVPKKNVKEWALQATSDTSSLADAHTLLSSQHRRVFFLFPHEIIE